MANTRRVLIRGGSIAAGYGVQRSYVESIREKLPFVEVLNQSRIRDTSFQGVWTFYEDIDIHKPDVLVLHFGIDDAYQPVYRSEFKENLVQIVRLARKRFDPQIILLTSHPFENPYDMEMIYIYYRVIREIAVDMNCDMVPVHVYWSGILEEMGRPISDYVQDDCRYPNERGHELYAHAVLNKITETLH